MNKNYSVNGNSTFFSCSLRLQSHRDRGLEASHLGKKTYTETSCARLLAVAVKAIANAPAVQAKRPFSDPLVTRNG